MGTLAGSTSTYLAGLGEEEEDAAAVVVVVLSPKRRWEERLVVAVPSGLPQKKNQSIFKPTINFPQT